MLSIFETHTEAIRKGKAHKPNEFGKLVLFKRRRTRSSRIRVSAEAGRLYVVEGGLGATRPTVRTCSAARGGRSRIFLRS